MTDYGPQDTSTTTLGANQFPIAENWTPNAGFSAVEGGPQSTDAGGKKSAPVSVYAKDGSNVTQGAQADAAYTDGTGAASGTGMGLFKGIFVKLAAIATAIVGTLKVKGDFTEVAGQGTGVVTGTGTFLLPETDISAYKHFSMTLSGTWSLTLIVEVSDTSGGNYETLIVNRANLSVFNFSSLTANGTYDAPLKWRYIRVRVSAFTSNASLAGMFEFHTSMAPTSVVYVAQAGTLTVQPGNTANTTPWLASDHDGTNKANNLAATSVSNALSNQSARLMAGAVQEVSFTTTIVQAVASTDVSNYRWISVMVGAQGTSSTVTFQTSNDNSNWFSCILFGSSAAPSSGASSTTTTGIWHGPLPGRYFRLNVTGISAGTTSGVIELYTVPATPHTIGASALQNGTWTMQPGNTQNTTPWMVTAAGLPTGLASYVIKEVKSVSVTAGTGLSIWTPAGGKKFRLIGWDLAPVTASSQSGIQFQDTVTYNTANEFLRVPRFLSVNWTPTPRTIGPNGYLSTAANNQLWIDVTVTTNVEGYVYGFEE